jgi:hypothetical protein
MRTEVKYRERKKGKWLNVEFEKEEEYCMKCFVTLGRFKNK